MTPEQQARVSIDALLQQAGWHVCSMADVNIHGYRGVALREFPLKTGFGFADYLLYVDGKAAGVIEDKKASSTLSGVEVQFVSSAQGLPDWGRPWPPRAEQERIASEVDRKMSLVRSVEDEVDANRKRGQALRQSVLASAFSS
jgi:hypothetical protein